MPRIEKHAVVPAFLVATLLASIPCPARGQAWSRFAVPDSALGPALRGAGGEFENAWNTLLVTGLKASLARADSAEALTDLARRVARAEPGALGSRIAADAIALRARWTAHQVALRVSAADAEAAGTAAQRAAQWSESDSLFGVALAAYRALGERRREAWVLGSAGSTWFLAGDYARAGEYYRAALAARRAIGDSSLVARAVNTLGNLAYLQNRNAEALEHFRHARVLRESLGDRAGLTATLSSLGLVTAALGQADSADAWFRQALELAVARGDSTRVAEALSGLASLQKDRGELDRAAATAERAAAIAAAREDARALARLRSLLGDVLRLQGRFTEAAASLAEAATQNAAMGDVRGEMESLLSLGVTWLDLGDPERAQPPLLRAATLADSLQDGNAAARALNNLALALRQAGDEREATRTAQRGLALASGGEDSLVVANLSTTLGQLASGRQTWNEARSWFERAAGAFRGRGLELEAAALINLGYVATMEMRTADAERHFHEALALGQRANAPDRVWLAMLGMGDAAERRGDFAGALDWDRRAATLIDTLRSRQREETGSIALFSHRLFAYEALIHLLGKLDAAAPDSGYAAEAFQWSERARARSLLDQLQASGSAAERVDPLSLGRARALVRSDRDALLAYSLGDSSSSLWVVTRRSWRRFTLPSRQALRTRVEVLRRGLADPATAESQRVRTAARSLYETLVAPAAPLLKGVQRLVIAPDGPLALVPFEALLVREVAEGAAVPRGAWLVERFDVSYTPSVTTLASVDREAHEADPLIVALGDPRFTADGAAAPPATSPASIPALPYTAEEVAALRALAGRRPVETLTGKEATRERLLALPGLARAGIVHLATHGEVNEAEPRRSGLWLAWDGAGPGFLSMQDILGLGLDADLVTLSACETGVGRMALGEGVLGLPRAFFAVGARSVVVSLWKVNDHSAARLMERFYRALLARGLPRDGSLAAAKRSLLADPATRSPFHWAPFVLMGARGPVR